MLAPLLATLFATQAVASAVEAPVLDRMVERGEILSAADFTVDSMSAAQARGAIDPQVASGKEASRRLRMGSIVRASDVIEPRLVRRGEQVTIEIRSAGLLISTAGRALADGSMGDAVRVVANSTNRTLDAEVKGSGVVRIAMP